MARAASLLRSPQVGITFDWIALRTAYFASTTRRLAPAHESRRSTCAGCPSSNARFWRLSGLPTRFGSTAALAALKLECSKPSACLRQCPSGLGVTALSFNWAT